MGNVYLIVIDGLGVGAQEDAAQYGDDESNTLAHVCASTKVELPNFQKLGLGNIIPLKSVPENDKALAATGKMREVSGGKDSTTGHWEIAGIELERPFPTYPNGFPSEVINQLCEVWEVENILCNQPYSGTEVIKDFGVEHMRTGYPIVYTSADSVLQVACHIENITLEKLYKWCEMARKKVMTGKHGVGRVIARPFEGREGAYRRISEKRHDYSLHPPEPNLLAILKDAGIKRYSIGKVVDLFHESYFTQYRHTKSNAEGISQLLSSMSAVENSLVFVNLIDTDQKYGHRQDPDGYARALAEFDRCIPALISKVRKDDLLIITGDHGNDPTDDSTDHTREFVPLLVFPKTTTSNPDLGIRTSFRDITASILAFWGIKPSFGGISFI